MAKNRTELLKKATYKMMIRTLFAVAVPGILGVLVGLQVDKALGTKPWATLIIMAVLYLISWVVIMRIAKDIYQTVKETEEEQS